jgi:hypothetical protein
MQAGDEPGLIYNVCAAPTLMRTIGVPIAKNLDFVVTRFVCLAGWN